MATPVKWEVLGLTSFCTPSALHGDFTNHSGESHRLRLKLFFRTIRDFAFIFLHISARADTGQLNGPRTGKDPEPSLQVLDVQLLSSDHG